MSGQNPPKDSACSSSRSSQNGAQPPEDSRKSSRSPGWRSSVPNAISWAQASIDSNECDTAWRSKGLNGRSAAEGGDDDRAPLMDADGHVELLGRVPHDVVGAVGERTSLAGVGADEAGDETELGSRRDAARGPRRWVLQRNHGRTEEPARLDRAVPGQPVVVGGGEGHRSGGILDDGEIQADRRDTGPPDRCPRRPCRAGGRPGPIHRGGRRPGGGRRLGRRRSSRVGRGCRAARPGPRCRRSPRARSPMRPRRCGAGTASGSAAQADSGSTTWPSASTMGPARGGSGGRPSTVTPVAMRQSLTSGSRCRKSRLALPPATARSSSSGSAPQVAASTRWVSGQDESACG